MNLLEMKNRLALETAKLIFQNSIEVVFIGGTALNTFHINYRYSEDLDLAYQTRNPKTEIEDLLVAHGYAVDKTSFNFRDIISLDAVSIKLDVLKYEKKYNGTTTEKLGETTVTTLKIEEFSVEKTISFFTREDIAGLARDAHDLFSIENRYHNSLDLAKKAEKIIKKNVSSFNYNIDLFENNRSKVESAVGPYLRTPIIFEDVLEFLKKLQGVLVD
ncbi:MAG: nucleotidyl transferase AbiEii/AbiGii toxin family protein [Candidatus Micrarchaeota archaeon]|nr:nucleotidyl transferase AbiEii/AbiGii toxin family protein [Candidatus Micrarchaeota archaeon]